VRLTPERLSEVLLSERGSRKGCPSSARFAVMINQVTERDVGFVDEVAGLLDGEALLVAVSPV